MKEKELLSVINYEGDNTTFVWKHPFEDFQIGSQLIVHESQEAIFYRDGKALDLFGAGRHTLTTQNLSVLGKNYDFMMIGGTPFHSEVYFINLVTQMGIKWGTDSKIRLFDPNSGLHIEIGACGQFNLRITNSRKVLVKLVGAEKGLFQGDFAGGNGYGISSITAKFKSLVITKVKSLLAKTIKEKQINILEIDEHLDTISNILQTEINIALDEYGFVIPEFYVTTIQTPDDEPNFKRLKQQYAEQYLRVKQEQILKAEAEAAQARKLIEQETLAKQRIIEAQGQAEAYRLQAEAEAKEMAMKGYTYQQETQRIVGSESAKNTSGGGVGGIAKDVIGIGLGIGVMGQVVGAVKDSTGSLLNQNIQAGTNIVNPTVNPKTWECPSCHTKDISSPFCPTCGTKKPESTT
jgi:membrane protease subunit (stomatin/prohibitin family)